MSPTVAVVVGALVSIVGGAAALWLMALWLGGERPAREAVLVGIVERTIYFVTASIGAYELAAGWLILKAWQEKSRAEHHWYLIGVGTSLLFGVSGGFIARLWAADLVAKLCNQ